MAEYTSNRTMMLTFALLLFAIVLIGFPGILLIIAIKELLEARKATLKRPAHPISQDVVNNLITAGGGLGYNESLINCWRLCKRFTKASANL